VTLVDRIWETFITFYLTPKYSDYKFFSSRNTIILNFTAGLKKVNSNPFKAVKMWRIQVRFRNLSWKNNPQGIINPWPYAEVINCINFILKFKLLGGLGLKYIVQLNYNYSTEL